MQAANQRLLRGILLHRSRETAGVEKGLTAEEKLLLAKTKLRDHVCMLIRRKQGRQEGT